MSNYIDNSMEDIDPLPGCDNKNYEDCSIWDDRETLPSKRALLESLKADPEGHGVHKKYLGRSYNGLLNEIKQTVETCRACPHAGTLNIDHPEPELRPTA